MSWYFSKQQIENSPSRRAGISEADENKLRKEGAKFIMTCSASLGLRYDTIATAVVFFHRFYMVESIAEYKKAVLASACMLLAGKVEETPKKARDVLKTAKDVLKPGDWAAFGEDPKESLFMFERILLKRINFELNVSHPYTHLLKFAKGLKGDKTKLQKLVQVAWNFINDSLVTTLCLQWEPEPAAIAFLYLAAKLSKLDLQGASKKSWWLKFVNNVDQHDLEDICGIVLDSYDEDEMEKEGLQIMTAAANVTSTSLDRRKSFDGLNHYKDNHIATVISNSLDSSLLAMQHAPLSSSGTPLTEDLILKQLFNSSTQMQASQLASYTSLLTKSIPPLDPKAVAQAQTTLNNLLSQPSQIPINLTPTAPHYNNFIGHGPLTPTPPPPPPPPPPPTDPYTTSTPGKHPHRERHNSSAPPPPKRPPPILTATAAPPLPYPLDPPPRPRQPPQPPPPPPPPSYPHHYHPPHSHAHGRAAN